MKEKKPPNYKFLGGEAEETGDRRCFYETPVIESKSKTKPSMCKEKGNKLFRKQAKSASPSIPNT
jgi:hypothetical protein